MLYGILGSLFLCILCCITRVNFISLASSDRDTHVWLLSMVSRHGRREFAGLEWSPIPGDFAYPIFVETVISKIGKSSAHTKLLVLVVGSDAATSVLLFATLFKFGASFSVSLLISALWVTLPILHPVNARLTGFGTRTFGNLLFLCFVLLVFWEPSFVAGLMLGSILTAAILLSSQFCSQVLVVSVVSLCILTRFEVVGWLLGGLVISSVAFRHDFFRQIRGKMQHYRWYLRYGISFLDHRTFRSLLNRYRSRGFFRGVLPSLFRDFPISVAFLGISPLIISCGWMILSDSLGARFPSEFSGSMRRELIFLVLGLAVAFSLTMFWRFRVFGEPERYIEYATLPFVLLLGTVVPSTTQNEFILAVGLAIALVMVLSNLAFMRQQEIASSLRNGPDQETLDLLDVLQQTGPCRVLTSPLFLASSLATHDVSGNRYQSFLVAPRQFELGFWPTGDSVYPFPSLVPDKVFAPEAFDAVVVSKAHMPAMTGSMDPKQLGSPDFENLSFAVYLRCIDTP